MNLSARLARAEAQVLPPTTEEQAHIFDVVAAIDDREAAIECALQNGCREHRDMLILHHALTGQELYAGHPYVARSRPLGEVLEMVAKLGRRFHDRAPDESKSGWQNSVLVRWPVKNRLSQ